MYALYERDPAFNLTVQTKAELLHKDTAKILLLHHYDRISHTPTGLEPYEITDENNPVSERNI